MGMSQNGKMMEFPEIIKMSKNEKNDGNFQKWKIPEFSKNWINAGKFQKSNILGVFPVLGWVLVIN